MVEPIYVTIEDFQRNDVDIEVNVLKLKEDNYLELMSISFKKVFGVFVFFDFHFIRDS